MLAILSSYDPKLNRPPWLQLVTNKSKDYFSHFDICGTDKTGSTCTTINIDVECHLFKKARGLQGFHYHFNQKDKWFSRVGKTIRSKLLRKKNFPLDRQTRRARSFLQPVNLLGVRPLMKTLGLGNLKTKLLLLKICIS